MNGMTIAQVNTTGHTGKLATESHETKQGPSLTWHHFKLCIAVSPPVQIFPGISNYSCPFVYMVGTWAKARAFWSSGNLDVGWREAYQMGGIWHWAGQWLPFPYQHQGTAEIPGGCYSAFQRSDSFIFVNITVSEQNLIWCLLARVSFWGVKSKLLIKTKFPQVWEGGIQLSVGVALKTREVTGALDIKICNTIKHMKISQFYRWATVDKENHKTYLSHDVSQWQRWNLSLRLADLKNWFSNCFNFWLNHLVSIILGSFMVNFGW